MKLALLTAALLLSQAEFAAAEPAKTGKIGRYQDGRAFRVDAQGYQLTDQIAELEVTIREQEKQITSCEERLERAEGGSALPAANSSGSSASNSVSEASCAVYTTPLELRISDLQNRDTASAPVCDYTSRTAPLQAQIAQLQAALSRAPKAEVLDKMSERSMALKSSLEGERQQFSEQVRNLQEERARTSQLQAELAHLKQQLAQKTTELASRDAREKELLASLDRASDERASARDRSASVSPSTSSSSGGRAMMAGSAPVAVAGEVQPTEISGETKKRIQSDLSMIQKLIVQRKDLFDSVRTARKGVTVGIQPLQTSSRVTLDQLRGLAQKANSQEQAGLILSGFGEIKAILKSDIEVLDRLLKRL